MGLDISVGYPDGPSREMNWLRNPFGLCNWAEANYNYVTKQEPPEEQRLWYVINHWNYSKSVDVDRKLFLDVVKRYGEVILSLTKGYYWFDVSGYIQFVEPHLSVIPRHDPLAGLGIGDGSLRIVDSVYHDRQIGIPVDYFNHACFGLRHCNDRLAKNQDWYRELMEFAEMLQDPETVFYCSN